MRSAEWPVLPSLLAGVDSGRVLLVSSAMAYGAWPANPVPLDETAPLRPNPGHQQAAAAAEAERVARRWAADWSRRELVVLRPVPVVAPGDEAPSHLPLVDSTAPVQFLHPEDLASAISVAATIEAGTYNVAPDGSVDAVTARALMKGMAGPGLPRRVAGLLAGWTGHPAAPAAVAFRTCPWVVDNSRLRSAGWAPRHDSEQAWVAAYPGSELAELPAGRRQKVVLALAVSVLGAAGLATLEFIRRRRS